MPSTQTGLLSFVFIHELAVTTKRFPQFLFLDCHDHVPPVCMKTMRTAAYLDRLDVLIRHSFQDKKNDPRADLRSRGP